MLRSRIARVVLLVKNCYFLSAKLKFVTFVMTLSKVVTFSLDGIINWVSPSLPLFL